jgi:hypothetical protein
MRLLIHYNYIYRSEGGTPLDFGGGGGRGDIKHSILACYRPFFKSFHVPIYFSYLLFREPCQTLFDIFIRQLPSG